MHKTAEARTETVAISFVRYYPQLYILENFWALCNSLSNRCEATTTGKGRIGKASDSLQINGRLCSHTRPRGAD